MSNKDFSNSNDMLALFSNATLNNTNTTQEQRENKERTIEKQEKTKSVKSDKPIKRGRPIDNNKKPKVCDIYVRVYDTYIKEFLDNSFWIKKEKNTSDYIRGLIIKDMKKTLNLSDDISDDQLSKEWDKFKNKNNI